MAEGFETRQVVQAAGPSGNANRPARQLGLVNVQAPRGGNMNEVGASQRALAEAVKMGGKVLSGYLKKKEEDDRLLGEMDYAEGKTESELKERGVNRSRMEGFKALKMKTSYNEWYAQVAKNIEERDYALTTEEFKQQLHAGWRELSDQIDPNDTQTRKLLAGMAADGFGKLVSTHVAANTQYMAGESATSLSNLLYSEAQTGDIESLAEVAGNVEQLVPNLSADAVKGSTMSAVRQSLLDGNVDLYDVFGQEEGLRKRFNLDEGEVKSLKAAYKQYQTQEESANMADISKRTNDILLDVKAKGISREEALSRMESLREEYRQSPGYMRALMNQVDQFYFDRDLTEHEAATLYDPAYLDAKADLINHIGWEGLQDGKGVSDMLKIADKFGLRYDMVLNDLKEVVSAEKVYRNRQNTKLEELFRKQEQEREIDRKGTALLNSNFGRLYEYSENEKQRAMEMKRGAIVQEVANNPRFDTDEEKTAEIIRQHVSFLRDVPVKDKRVKQDFQIVGQSSPLAEDGTLQETHLQAFQYVSAMQEAGLSERTIKDYTGGSYDYLAVAADLANGAVDPKTALATAWEQVQIPEGKRPTPKTDVKEAQNAWEDVKEDFFDDIEPGVIASWLSSESDGKYDEVLTWQVTEAARDSVDMDRWAKERISLYSKTYPNMRQDAIMGLVKRDLSRWEYVMGNMVPPKDGKSLTESMGLSETPGTLKTNSAMIMYMRDNAELLFPKGTDQRAWWDKFVSGAGEALDTMIFTPEKVTGLLVTGDSKNKIGTPVSFLQDVLFFASEKEQRLANDIKMIDVTPLSNGQVMISLYSDTDKEDLVGMPIAVPARDVGDWYKEQTKQRQFEKNLPRR